MSDISFYPGPSRVYSSVNEYIYEAYKDGIMSMNHRSPEFMEMMSSAKKHARLNLNIPEEYEIMFVSSATETWEIIAQSLIKETSQHFYNGAFGEKWADYTEKLGRKVIRTEFDLNAELPLDKIHSSAEWICITQNETSNGSQVTNETIAEIRDRSQGQLIAVDATSSMAGIHLDYEKADLWYASVQKCFGLPAGLAVMVCSPAVVKKAESIGEYNHYNSFLRILENHLKNQTHYTPNVLDIYLFYRTNKLSKGIDHINNKVNSRFNNWTELIEKLNGINWLVENEKVRSRTVLSLTHNQPEKVKEKAKKSSLILGNGYGKWKETTFRVANFPAMKGKEIEKLANFFERNYS